MIIKGGAAQNVGWWGKHLLRDDTNEKVIVHETRGVLAQELEPALDEMRDVSLGSRCKKNFMYQVNINPLADEQLTPQQWQQAVDTLEKNMGFEGHQRVVVEHVKYGRQHYHVIWSRINPDTLRTTDIGGDRYTMRRTANQLEREFGLSRTAPTYADRKPDQDQPFAMWELDRAARTKIDPNHIKDELSQLWRTTKNGPDFENGIAKKGYILARGDRRGFVILDQAGKVHSLAKRLDGVNTKEVRARLAHLDISTLPSVAEAKAMHRDRLDGASKEIKADPDIANDRFAKVFNKAQRSLPNPPIECSLEDKLLRQKSADRGGHGDMVSEQCAALKRFDRNHEQLEARRLVQWQQGDDAAKTSEPEKPLSRDHKHNDGETNLPFQERDQTSAPIDQANQQPIDAQKARRRDQGRDR